MARPLRLEFAGALYQLTARGNARGAIFLDDADRRLFLERSARAVNPAYQERGIVKSPDGGIAGVCSLSDAQPIKTANFGPTNPGFEDKKKYSEWQFVYFAIPTASPKAQSPTDQKRAP